MIKRSWNKWAALLVGSGLLLQTPACTETATVISTVAQVISAGGVLYIVSRIMQ
jgi:hypothetical protein